MSSMIIMKLKLEGYFLVQESLRCMRNTSVGTSSGEQKCEHTRQGWYNVLVPFNTKKGLKMRIKGGQKDARSRALLYITIFKFYLH